MSICPECGQKIRPLNPHRMCRNKVEVLRILARAKCLTEEGWAKVSEGFEIWLPTGTIRTRYRARAHASRLVWFGLAEHGDVRSGNYRIADAGIRFLGGKLRVPAVIYCKDGVVRRVSQATVCVRDVRGVVLDKDYWDAYAKIQLPDPDIPDNLGQGELPL